MLINQALSKSWEAEMKIDIVSIPDNSAMGTADSLRHIKDKIKVKFIQLLVPYLTGRFSNVLVYQYQLLMS